MEVFCRQIHKHIITNLRFSVSVKGGHLPLLDVQCIEFSCTLLFCPLLF